LAPGLTATQADNGEVGEIVRRMFGTRGAPGQLAEDETRLADVLVPVLQPDVSLSPPVPGIGFVHRSLDSAEVYFLANTDNVRHRTEAAFRVQGLQPECWDPLSGKVLPVQIVTSSPGALSIALDLEAYGSRVIVFSRNASPNVETAGGVPAPIVDLSTDWQVRFGDENATVTMGRLRSWTEEDGRLYFSGLAAYEKTFVVPDAYLSTQARPYLSLGEAKPAADQQAGSRTPRLQALVDAPVREAAVVEVNGERAGTVWCPPYRIDLTGLLRPGENRLRIVIGNLAINYMAGHAPADYRLLNLRYGTRFEPQDMDQVRPIPSGLLGPVTLGVNPPQKGN
jgi:hypothetical protein